MYFDVITTMIVLLKILPNTTNWFNPSYLHIDWLIA